MNRAEEIWMCLGKSSTFLAVAFAVAIYTPSSVQGFVPSNQLQSALGSTGQTHESITAAALVEVDLQFFPTRSTTSMAKAIDEIIVADIAVDDDQTKAAPHFDGESFPEGQARLIDLLLGIRAALNNVNGEAARTRLGQALHTIQDFYSHSNWIELGNQVPNPDLGRPGHTISRLPAEIATCAGCTACLACACQTNCSANITTNELTSGYFSGEDREKPDAKCSHGGPKDLSTFLGTGINKDSMSCRLSSHWNLHSAAAGLAKEATKQFIRDIRDLVSLRQFKLLLGVGSTMAIAMDTTGSMGPIIDSVKRRAVEIVDARLGTVDEPSKYILVPFNDPGVGPAIVTDDPNSFKSAINALTASGGGDCPELSMGGIYQALAASDRGSDLFVFTDASSKDSALAASVSSLATSKAISVHPLLFGSCSPIDPAYIQVANESGGQLFALSPFEGGDVTKLIDFIVRSNTVNVLSINATLSGASKMYTVPIDSTMTGVTFSVSGSLSVVVRRPDGTTVLPEDAGVNFVFLNTGVIVSIPHPASGTWGVDVDGLGSFSLAASGESALDLASFRFVEPGGRPGHEGWFPITGFPVTGQMATAVGVMTGEVATAQFELRTQDGAIVQPLGLTSDADVAADEFFGDVSLPNGPFLVYVTGLDTGGNTYQRVLSGAFASQTVKISAPPTQDLQPGQTTKYIFRIKNLGAADTFRFSASDDQRFLRSSNPETFTLNLDETTDVTVQLQAPVGALPGTSDTLAVTVESVGSAGTRNFAILMSTVATDNNPPEAGCLGDCSGDAEVTVDELIAMANIALGSADLAQCQAGDGNGDGSITVTEIVAAVSWALSGCTTVPQRAPQ